MADRSVRALVAVAAAAASWGAWSLFLRPAELPSATAGAIVFLVMGLTALPAARRAPPITWYRRAYGPVAAKAGLYPRHPPASHIEARLARYETGAVPRPIMLLNGKKEGLMTDFYPDGKVMAERMFASGKQAGKIPEHSGSHAPRWRSSR